MSAEEGEETGEMQVDEGAGTMRRNDDARNGEPTELGNHFRHDGTG